MPDITYDVGRVSFVMKGAWNLATSYEKLDAVSYNGSLFIAKQDVPGGTAITNTTYWQLAAEKGDKGDTGGVDSVNGQQGDVWFPDSRQLISDGYTTDTDPFLMKGNDSDSDRFELAKKLGNTVCVNQLVPDADTHIVSSASNAWGNIGNFFFSLIAGHTYRIALIGKTVSDGYSGEVGGGRIRIRDVPEGIVGNLENGAKYNGYYTASKTTNGTTLIQGYWAEGDTDAYLKISDLTLWFGSNDRIPSDLLSHPENWGRYYAGSLDYNAGTLESADGTVMKSIGRQVWDEEWDIGDIDGITGEYKTGNNLRNKNLIPVIPNTAYYLKIPYVILVTEYDSNGNAIINNGSYSYHWISSSSTYTMSASTHFIAFHSYSTESTYNHDITLSLYYSGESGYDQYYPYTVLAEVDTGSEVLRSAGSVADEKLPSGAITRIIGVVDLGTLNYGKGNTSSGHWRFSTEISSIKRNAGVASIPNIICPKYVAGSPNNTWSGVTCITVNDTTSHLLICDESFSDAATLKTALSGVYLYYELATPTTEQGTAFDPLVVTVKNGVLSWTNTKGIPVGQESHWFENLRKRVEDRLPDPPSADGTYRLTCTISGGVKTYSWEA